MSKPSTVRTVLLTTLILLTLLNTAGCATSSTSASSSTTGSSSTTTDASSRNTSTGENDRMKDAFDTLLKRPSITAVDADYESMFQTIRDRLSAEVGVADWVPDNEPISGSACDGDISKLDDAVVSRYDAGMSPGNLPDAKWEQAVAIVTEVARQHGFGTPTVIVNRPSDHEVSFRDSFNGELLFGTGANTILGGSTGCHLTEEAHQRGAYLPPKNN